MERQRKLGRLPVRERIERLIDPAKRVNRRFPLPSFLELNLWNSRNSWNPWNRTSGTHGTFGTRGTSGFQISSTFTCRM